MFCIKLIPPTNTEVLWRKRIVKHSLPQDRDQVWKTEGYKELEIPDDFAVIRSTVKLVFALDGSQDTKKIEIREDRIKRST